MVAVHPRSRGEHQGPAPHSAAPAGSSPLARGTRVGRSGGGPDERFIPARAGNTWVRTPPGPLHPVHPRSRGEHASTRSEPSPSAGSSPLARGTQPHRAAAPRHPRFIPARAGNTATHQCARSPSPVHPRSRGEHTAVGGKAVVLHGSSPLARGTLQRLVLPGHPFRFIPARAGNTCFHLSLHLGVPVHPRSRGEHGDLDLNHLSLLGSSPLARGTQSC